jgi:hypothetical protein
MNGKRVSTKEGGAGERRTCVVFDAGGERKSREREKGEEGAEEGRHLDGLSVVRRVRRKEERAVSERDEEVDEEARWLALAQSRK